TSRAGPTPRPCRASGAGTTPPTATTRAGRARPRGSPGGWRSGCSACRTGEPTWPGWTRRHCGCVAAGPRRPPTTAMSERGYTPQELMVAAAAREIRDGELVFVGMRLPILAYGVARGLHAPGARALFELGLMRDRPAASFLATMGDPPNVAGALWATRMSNVMALLAQGEVDLGFIGGAEVDRFGNLNTSAIGDPRRPAVKLPGSGGAADIAILARRWVTLMSHEPRRLVERVSHVTSPG